MIRTKEQLKQMFLQSQLSQQRKKDKQKQKYKKASQDVKKLLMDKSIKQQKQTQPETKETHYRQISITIYHSNFFERETREEELYSKYELQHIEELYPEEVGRINWMVFNNLVEKLRKTL